MTPKLPVPAAGRAVAAVSRAVTRALPLGGPGPGAGSLSGTSGCSAGGGVGPSVTARQGTDWPAVRTFAGIVALVVVAGPVLGRAVAGPVGIVIGAGLAALVILVAAHVSAARSRTAAGSAGGVVAYASTADSTTGSAGRVEDDAAAEESTHVRVDVLDDDPDDPSPTDALAGVTAVREIGGVPVAFVWGFTCDVCRVTSLPTPSPDEANAHASVHDGLHHGGRPTATLTALLTGPAGALALPRSTAPHGIRSVRVAVRSRGSR